MKGSGFYWIFGFSFVISFSSSSSLDLGARALSLFRGSTNLVLTSSLSSSFIVLRICFTS